MSQFPDDPSSGAARTASNSFAPTARTELPPDRPPRAAATLVVVRDGAEGLEVLLLQRAERNDLNSGAWVFPGGLLDASDHDAHAHATGVTDAALSAEMQLPHGGLDYLVAALRETFEEAGLLYACDAQGQAVDESILDTAAREAVSAWRARLHAGTANLAQLCTERGWRLTTDQAVYLSHWVTPPGRAKRFDTRFFLACAPAGQTARPDDTEVTRLAWMRPADALAAKPPLKLMSPTRKTLEALGAFTTTDQAMAWAREPRPREAIIPHVGTGHAGSRPVTPDEPCWAELRHIDPLGYGDASYDIVPGVPVRLSARVVRVTAPNGSVMTGPGTNSYFIGGGPDNEWALLDPGPADETHVRALLAAAPGRITRVLVTHTHTDHSPAAALLRAHLDAPLHGRHPAHPQWQDAGFAPDQLLHGGERLTLTPEATLRVIHTPGHASNHLCYLLEEEQMLFTGDHVMQGSTVVINPPDGDMQAYLDSLAALRDELGPTLEWLAPGHGFLIAKPVRAFETLIRHRLQREAKVLRCLQELTDPAGASVATDALLARVYDDVPAGRLGVARRSLVAHLEKLLREGRVVGSDVGWLPS